MATSPHFSFPHQRLEEMMRNLRVDSSSQLPNSNKVPSKEESPSDAKSCISSAGDAIGSLKESDADRESLATDQGVTYQAVSYYGYYYPGYNGSFWELDDQGFYVAGDGMELQYPVLQADNGSFMYMMPAFQPSHSSYGPFLPVTTFGVHGQYLGQQPFSPGPLFQSSIASSGYYPNTFTYGELVASPYPCDPSFLVGDAAYGNNYNEFPEIPSSKSNVSSASCTHAPLSKKLSHSDFGYPPEMKNSLPSLEVLHGQDVHKQLKPMSKALQHGSTLQSDAPGKAYLPFAKFPLSNQVKVGVLYSNCPVTYKANVRGWVGSEKVKTRSRVNGIIDFGLFNEQKHVPRTTNIKDALMSGDNAIGPLATDENVKSDNITSLIRRDKYNLPDFPTKYDHALFFVIKSYSEDDIHKSIKYNVWASTPNGNKRLDSAYENAQDRKAEKGSKCPMFLFFSVNASGQFCGVAEMIGRVDFNKSMDFWQQDKWNGYFPVKWHIIKDIPNPQLRHIILENNDKKPVTNSRDTQEVRFSQGIEMLNVFKNYPSKTSILDDFDFYESRQKVMQEKKIRPSMLHHNHIQLKADELASNFQSVDLSVVDKAEEPRKE